jgi:hypothetical protein
MALNGRNPAMAICAGSVRYQGTGGTSRGNLAVRQGASYSPRDDFPAAPPSTVSGSVTPAHTASTAAIVPGGKACVLPLAHATLLATANTRNKGPQNNPAVSRTLPAQRRPPSMRYQQADE